MASKQPNLVTKLSLKSMSAQPKKNSFSDGDEILPPRVLAVIYGRANKYEMGTSSFGDFTKFKGRFEGINVETGEVYSSGACFLPAVVEDMIVSALDEADGASVEFALEIGAKHSSANTGYEYTVKPLTEPVETDELSGLRAVVKDIPALTHDGSAAKSDKKKK